MTCWLSPGRAVCLHLTCWCHMMLLCGLALGGPQEEGLAKLEEEGQPENLS
jgi:hypothetical protein